MDPTIPDTCLSVKLTEFNKPLQFISSEVPNPGHNEVLIKMEIVGVCHTDLHVMKGDWKYKPNLPITLGHEGVGRICKIGPNVKHLKIGDKVCTAWLNKSCSNCEYCWSGWETLCETQTNYGFTVNGSFSEYVLASADFCNKVPEELSSEQAAPITCAGVTTYKALKESNVHSGQWIVIVGAAGGLGHVAIQYAKTMGMKVIGVDCGLNKLEFMKNLGCEGAIDAEKMDVTQQVMTLTNGKGAHGSIILVPRNQAIKNAVDYLRRRGTIVLVALPPGEFSANTVDVVLKAITIKGSIVGTRLDLDEALRIAGEGKIKCNIEVRNVREVNQILEDLEQGKFTGRIVMNFG